VGSTEKSATKALPVHTGAALRRDFSVAFPIANYYMSGCTGLAVDCFLSESKRFIVVMRAMRGVTAGFMGLPKNGSGSPMKIAVYGKR
jgi:hypothetical protein